MVAIPFMEHCGLEFIDAPAGAVRVTVRMGRHLTNSRGQAYGGLLMTMLDIALGRACRSAVTEATSFATIDMNVVFLAGAQGQITAEGRVLRAGRSIVFCEGEVRDQTGTIVARASGVFKPMFPQTRENAEIRTS